MSGTRGLGPIASVIAVCATGYGVAWSRPAGGEYAGLSKQGLPFKLTVADDRATLTFDVRWACRDARRPANMFRRRGVALADDGAFSWQGRNVYVDDDYEIRQRLRLVGRDNG